MWQSTDAGRTWEPLWHLQSVLNIGALAIHPTNPKILYCGTGEANLSADSYAGVGLYRTTNGGKTWQLFASCKKTGIPSRIGVIAIDPRDPNHIRIGGIGFGRVSPQEEGVGGMYTSRDAGKSWTREPSSPHKTIGVTRSSFIRRSRNGSLPPSPRKGRAPGSGARRMAEQPGSS